MPYFEDETFEEIANYNGIKGLIDRTNPICSSNFELKVDADLQIGFYKFYFKNKNNEESCIRLTTYVYDISEILEFLCDLIKIKCPICTLIRDEGEHGIFYARPINNNHIHFVVADDYELYKNFHENNVHYSFKDAHICLDIIIDKNKLIKLFYDKIWEQTKSYKKIKPDNVLWKGIRKWHIEYFNKLKEYLEENKCRY